MPFEALTKGYILIPKFMLEKMFGQQHGPLTECEAMIKLLITVNYKDTTMGQASVPPLLCRRGESLRSLKNWGTLFCWSRSKVWRFFQKLREENLLERLPNKYYLHIRVVDYDLWTGCRSEALQQVKENAESQFMVFWERYHEITGKDKVNLAKAHREWMYISNQEREQAIVGIEDYYYHLNNVKYCLQASSYLHNKAYLNEYND